MPSFSKVFARFRIDLVHAVQGLFRLGRGVINILLIIDRRIKSVGPVRLRSWSAVGGKHFNRHSSMNSGSPFFRNAAHDIFIQTGQKSIGLSKYRW